ncbi:hypothetical protein CP968_11390 [Streptomyces subrutilus]|uniref:Uncharacterized protein n=1 Tax=Streptomyces subrutilus TaxID=36818 RepID=A0A5P2UKD8_9ACTN|nr:hypothetical protein CP968_11390 [Streptomyces subrutilus]
MDSGNKGYASSAARCRPGGTYVTQVTSNGGFRHQEWRETTAVRVGVTQVATTVARTPDGPRLDVAEIMSFPLEPYVNTGLASCPEA